MAGQVPEPYNVKIALISPWPPEASGIADYAVLFKQALEAAGVEVLNPVPDLYTARTSADIHDAALRVPVNDVELVHFELGGGRIRHFLLLQELLKLHPGLRTTATIHDPNRIAWRGWGLARFEALPRRAQQALTILTDTYSLHAERRAAASLQRAVVLTQGGARALALRMRLPEERIQVIPIGNKDVPYLPPPVEEHMRLLFFGFLYPGKGIEDLIDAFVLARQQSSTARQRLRLTIAGGSQPTMLLKTRGNYVTELQDKLRAAGLEDCSEIITDIPEDTIPDLFQRHHALILPYRDSRKISLLGRFLGASSPLAWAIACGRGALVSDARSLAEEVARGNGAVFHQRDMADLAANLISVADDPEIVMRWSEAARKLARERTWKVTGQHFARLFADVSRQPV